MEEARLEDLRRQATARFKVPPPRTVVSRRMGTWRGGVEHLTGNQKLGPRATREAGRSPPLDAREMRRGETSWDIATLKRLENASRTIDSNSSPVSHLRARPSSTGPYLVLSGNDTTTIDPPADS